MITTKRLLLQRVTPSDASLFNHLLRCPKTTQYLPNGQPYTEQQIQHYVDNRIRHWQHGFGTFTVFLDENPKRAIGYAGVEWIADNPQYADIRYAILATENGKGYAVEAATAVLDYTFQQTALTTIYGAALRANRASIAVLKKLGMQTEQHIQLYDDKNLEFFKLTSCEKQM